MTKTSRTAFLWFRSDNRKPVVSSVEPSAIQNRKWLGCSVIAFMLALSGAVAQAQQPAKVYKVGRLTGGSPDDPLSKGSFEAFRQGLHELGWIEGRNIALEPRWTGEKPESLRDLAAELVRLRVDVIVANGSPMIRAAKQATTAVPIVMAATGADPVAAGFVASLARPGGNITGLSLLAAALDGKRLELLKEVVPGLRHVAVLQNPDFPEATNRWRDAEAAGKSLGVRLQARVVRSPHEIETAFSATDTARPNALLVFSDPAVLERHRGRIIALALKYRLPAIYPWRSYVEEGGLMVYGPSLPDMHRRSAYYVDKILKGAKPADLPVEQPTKFEFMINLKAAKQIGLTIPPTVLYRADKVIK
jgi:putative tryptophan/tyrosine transport system substrate-binding protein